MSAQSEFLVRLHGALNAALAPEMEFTMRVAVLSAAGYTRPQIVRKLEASDIEVKMAMIRLERVAEQWQ